MNLSQEKNLLDTSLNEYTELCNISNSSINQSFIIDLPDELLNNEPILNSSLNDLSTISLPDELLEPEITRKHQLNNLADDVLDLSIFQFDLIENDQNISQNLNDQLNYTEFNSSNLLSSDLSTYIIDSPCTPQLSNSSNNLTINLPDELLDDVLDLSINLDQQQSLCINEPNLNLLNAEESWNLLLTEFPFLSAIFEGSIFEDSILNENVQVGSGINFNIIQTEFKINNKFKCQERVYKLLFDPSNKTFAELSNDINRLFNELFSRFTNNLNNLDMVRVTFFHNSFNHPISIPFVAKENLTATLIIDKFERVIQSYKTTNFNYDDSFSAIVQIAKVYSGGHKRKRLAKQQKLYVKKPKVEPTNSFDSTYNNKYCIKTIYNSDNMCALRAILIAKAFYDKDKNRYKYLESNNTLFENMVQKCVKDLGLDTSQKCTLYEIAKIEMYLREYQITIIDSDGKLNKEAIYIGPINKHFLYISMHDNHFNAITSIKSYFNYSYFCDYCKIGYDHLTHHKCEAQCKSCRKFNCYKTDDKTYQCPQCKIKARSLECLITHKDLICTKYIKCNNCNMHRKKDHLCGDNVKFCKNCKLRVSLAHRCCIKPDKIQDKQFNGYIFFDYEARVNNSTHEPNLIIARKVCVDCLEEQKIECNNCVKKVFYTNADFCNWLFDQSYCIAIAHNLKGYDGVFVLNHILNVFVSTDSKPNVLMNGTKILSIEFRHIKLIDSYSFIPMGLDKFAKTFEIKELKKGFFPHLFNSIENENYIGPYPAKEYYSPQFFSESKYKEFELWYEEHKNKTFNFKTEFIDYCNSDVELLANGCLAFRKIIMSQTISENFPAGIDPFLKSITIASLCHYIFRNNLMKPDTIGIIPKLGYNPEQRTSIKCQLWLKYLASKNNIYIQHARNEGEFRIKEFLVDGYCKQTNTIYEFHGCIFHGCPNCFTPNTFNSIKKLPMGLVYKDHCRRIEKIKSSFIGSLFSEQPKLIEMWECDWDRLVKQDHEINNFVSNSEIKDPLNPRDAFYGGRTNALKLYHHISDDEIIKYNDITSLYPCVQKYCRYSVGHPEIITEHFSDVSNYFGFIKCRILPPKGLYIPVLPSKINNKLVFTLCLKCAQECLDNCTHNDEERSLEGTWCSLEIHKALEKGYKIVKIFEVWHWPESSQYDKETKTGGLFTDYINLFLKGKQQASDYPSNAKTDEEKQQYIKNYYDNEGIQLEHDQIKSNPGMRTVMKLLLNSFWGRFGMDTNKVMYKIIADPKEWYKMISDKQYVIHQVDFTHQKYLQVFYSINSEMFDNDTHVNVAIAAFVTCHARLKLYSELEKLNERVLYFDTDSVIFVSKKNEYEPKLGDYLGEFTNEIDPKEGNYIKEFVSAGPKNYGYKLDTDKSHAHLADHC
jgi:hypothetical protein